MKDILAQVLSGQSLSTTQTVDAFEQIMTGQATPAQIGALLGMLQQRGPTVEEITGAATVMRDKAVKVEVPNGLTAIDTCGTGGDHAGTFNISTAAAIVAAAVGRPHDVVVAKHGNRSVTSSSGSSNVLEQLGVKLNVTSETLTQCLDQAGICFCFAPLHHPAMKYAGPIRAELGFRTIFNMLGPLTNPAGAKRQIMGVFDADLTEPIAEVLNSLGSTHAMIVNGKFGNGCLDELSTLGPSQISEVKDGNVSTTTLDPATLQLASNDPQPLLVDSPDASAAKLREVFAGQQGSPRDIVLLNAAAALVVGGVAKDLASGVQLAGDAVDQGAVTDTLNKLVAITQADPTA